MPAPCSGCWRWLGSCYCWAGPWCTCWAGRGCGSEPLYLVAMKKFLLAGLLLAGLSGCSKDGSDPKPVLAVPELAGGTWAWTSETTVETNKATGAVTSRAKTVVPNTVKATYTTSGTYTVVADKSVTSTGANITTTGTYAYSGGIITYLVSGKTSTARVDVLTAGNLTLVATDENSTTRNVTTDTFTR